MTWELQADGAGVTDIDHAQASSAGSGTIDEVANIEGLLSGNYGEIFRMGQPVIFGSEYDTAAKPLAISSCVADKSVLYSTFLK